MVRDSAVHPPREDLLVRFNLRYGHDHAPQSPTFYVPIPELAAIVDSNIIAAYLSNVLL